MKLDSSFDDQINNKIKELKKAESETEALREASLQEWIKFYDACRCLKSASEVECESFPGYPFHNLVGFVEDDPIGWLIYKNDNYTILYTLDYLVIYKESFSSIRSRPFWRKKTLTKHHPIVVITTGEDRIPIHVEVEDYSTIPDIENLYVEIKQATLDALDKKTTSIQSQGEFLKLVSF